MSSSYNTTPIKYKLVTKNQSVVYVPLATAHNYGLVKAGHGLIIKNGIIALRNEVTRTLSFATYEQFEKWLAGDFQRDDGFLPSELSVGDIIRLEEKHVTDYWCKSKSTPVTIDDFLPCESEQNYIRFDGEQNLSENAKKIARDNIDVYSVNEIDSELTTIKNDINTNRREIELKQNKQDDSLMTDNKTVVGAINELNDIKVDKQKTGLFGSHTTIENNGSRISLVYNSGTVGTTDVNNLSIDGDGIALNSVTTGITGEGSTTTHKRIQMNGEDAAYVSDVENEKRERTAADNNLQSQIDTLEQNTNVTDVVGTYAQLLAYDVSKLTENDIIEVLQDETRNNKDTYYRFVSGGWSFVGELGSYYTKAEIDVKTIEQFKITEIQNVAYVDETMVITAVVRINNVKDIVTELHIPISSSDGSLIIDANEYNDGLDIHLDELLLPQEVNLSKRFPETSTQGILTDSEMATLQASKDNYITFDNDVYKISSNGHMAGYLIYACVERENNRNIIKIIGITTNTKAWQLSKTTVLNYETETIELNNIGVWQSISDSESPYTHQVIVNVDAVQSAEVVELLNNNPVLFAHHGFAINEINDTEITIYSIGRPSTVTFNIRIGG